MGKPWAKTEIGYTDHPKFLALNANAFSLWHEAKDYCEKHHTDGLIPREAVRKFRFGGAKSVRMLTDTRVEKADGTRYAPLWEPHLVGFKMHDYLDHNDCREVVLARMEAADERRDADRARKADWRAKKAEKAEMSRGTNAGQTPGHVADADVAGTSQSRSTTETTTVPTTSTTVSPEQKPPSAVTRFLTLYEELFVKAHGSKPVIVGKRDPGIAKQLIVKLGESDARALLVAFFESDDQFINEVGHGLNIFAGQANKLLSAHKVTKPRNGAEPAWMADYCFHKPCCETTEACRAKVAEEAAARA